jgi:P63C domain
MATKTSSDAAKVLSLSGAAKGGKARASTMTPEQRSEAARRAVTARWERAGKVPPKDTPKKAVKTTSGDEDVPYSMYPGTLLLGKLRLRCHVLNDGRRVLTQSEVMRVLRGRDTRTTSLSNYLAGLEGFDPKKLPSPITFRIPGLPRTALGYEAILLIDICDAYVEAWNAGTLAEHQVRIAVTAEIIIRACAKLGIIALIDEATGYQQVRAKNALELKLKAFIADDMQEWARMFPEEFWHELARLESVHYSAQHRPLRWGKYVMAFVYDAIDPDVGKALRKKNPNPHFLKNHHQWLRQHGQESVRLQIGKAVGIMQTCEDMQEFKHKFARIFNRAPLQLTLDDLG